MKEMNKKNNRIGEIRMMNCGEEAEIVEYREYSNITVRFLKTNELVKSCYGNFKKGVIKSHFTPNIFGVGIVGTEKVKNKYGKIYPAYITWRNMLQRCYDVKLKDKYSTYKNCTVCNEWLFYPNFKKWYEYNYYEIEGETMCLDKDILKKTTKFTVLIIAYLYLRILILYL